MVQSLANGGFGKLDICLDWSCGIVSQTVSRFNLLLFV